MDGFLKGKLIVIMGITNERSIAWGCAQEILAQGGKVIATYQNDRIMKSIERFMPKDVDMFECDVSEDENISDLFKDIGDKYGKIDGIIHAIAYADRKSLKAGLINTTREGYELAQSISSYSLIPIARYAKPILSSSSSIMTLTYFGSSRAIPNYNVMGVAKASLEANVRYLAEELGMDGVRVNAISAGAVKTLAVTGIKDHGSLLRESEARTVDKKSVTIKEIGDTAAFLMSDLSAGITGDIIYVDKGVHLI
ncbi:enoyl-ACP reductase FabI [Companilactobacillus nuruki]|uniref:Enoyl-[acyl-carrier-protein] reductase [NADH] n=1 Tax=Companilactobacillus nuruki TaxID=1993540 RepID=A0A2N7AWB2_9LACO|nr:enoyl-ACP reductase FabI [Companilactobacillus nuruki]PMD73029.1 enoyl-[acyl-carrier-protein] reductase [Companilactobacillus nuruki]